MPIRITDLIERVDPQIEWVVSNVRTRFNRTVRGCLRDETRLSLSFTGDVDEESDTRSVRVQVTPGYPAELNAEVFDDSLRLSLALAPLTGTIEEARSGLDALTQPIVELYQREDFVEHFADAGDVLESASKLLHELAKEAGRADLLARMFAIREDVLGAYRYKAEMGQGRLPRFENQCGIDLYWGVIGLTASLLGVSVEQLAVKVLVHELAHAYTHLGADADGRRWHSNHFSGAERSLKEGLAQFYTWRVLERLKGQAPGALAAAEKLLRYQPDIYHVHLPWLKHTPEEVREAMLAVRSRSAASLAEFEVVLASTRRRNRQP